MHFKIKLIIGIILTIFTSTSFAQGSSFRGMYFGGSYSNQKIKDVDERFNGGVIKVGYDLTNFLAIEGHGGLTIKETIVGSSGISEAHAEHAGIYARANWRLTNITLYGLVGYGYYKLMWDFTSSFDPNLDGTYEREESGLSYGLGLDLFGSGRTAVSLNLMQLVNEKDEFDVELNVQSIYLGITYYFNPQKTTHAP